MTHTWGQCVFCSCWTECLWLWHPLVLRCSSSAMLPYWGSVWVIHPLLKVVLKSPSVIALLCISTFRSVNICLMYICTLMLSAYIYHCYILLISWPLYHCTLTFFVSCCSIYLKVCLSDIGMVAPALFRFACEWNLLSLHFQPLCVLKAAVTLLKAAYNWVLFSYPFCHFLSFEGKFNPFTFKVVIDR